MGDRVIKIDQHNGFLKVFPEFKACYRVKIPSGTVVTFKENESSGYYRELMVLEGKGSIRYCKEGKIFARISKVENYFSELTLPRNTEFYISNDGEAPLVLMSLHRIR